MCAYINIYIYIRVCVCLNVYNICIYVECVCGVCGTYIQYMLYIRSLLYVRVNNYIIFVMPYNIYICIYKVGECVCLVIATSRHA